MNQEREPMDSKEIDIIIEKMQRRGKYSSEIIQLVQSDLELGISKEETEQYTNKRYDIRQMRVYSNCLRRNCTMEEISVICKEGLSNSQMEVLFDFFDKGVPLETIRSIMEEANAIPQRMKKAYEKYQEAINKSKSAVKEVSSEEKAEVETDYLKELITLLNGVSEKITYQECRYDELNKKLKLFETSKEDEAVRKNLIDEMDDKDGMLEKQQEEINKATGAIARLRKDKEDYEEEMKKMRDQIDDLQRKVKNQELDLQESNDKLEKRYMTDKADNKLIRESEQPIDTDADITATLSEQMKGDSQPITYGIPVYFQIPVVDGRGHIIQKVQLERTQRKTNGVVGLLSKICFKKSRSDIVKLVASGDLVPAQLVQIKSGIEKGLTEGQLVELINNNLSAEKMKEIIEIAVLENSMAY
jgi:DNA repair exonuclease SbcCD ATPase subunit